MQHQKKNQPPSYPGEHFFHDEQSQFPDYSFEDDFQTPVHSQAISGYPKQNPVNFSSRPLPQLPPQTTNTNQQSSPLPPQQTQAPYCKCGQPAVEKMSGESAKNPNQPFWTCSIGKDRGGCSYFAFLNPALNKFPAKNQNKRTYSQIQPQPQPQQKQQMTPDNSITETNLMLAHSLHLTTGKHDKLLIQLQQRMQAMEQDISIMKEHIDNLISPKPEETQKN